MAMTVATSRSAGLSTMPSAITRQPSFTTGKKMNSMMSCGLATGGFRSPSLAACTSWEPSEPAGRAQDLGPGRMKA